MARPFSLQTTRQLGRIQQCNPMNLVSAHRSENLPISMRPCDRVRKAFLFTITRFWPITFDNKCVGRVTSAVYSPRLQQKGESCGTPSPILTYLSAIFVYLLTRVITVKLTSTIAVFTLVLCVACACVASPPNADQIRADVRFAAGNDNVAVLFVGDGTVTLIGLVASRLDAIKALDAARNSEGIDKVNDHITIRN